MLKHPVASVACILFGLSISVRRSREGSTKTGASRRRRLSPNIRRNSTAMKGRRTCKLSWRKWRSTALSFVFWLTHRSVLHSTSLWINLMMQIFSPSLLKLLNFRFVRWKDSSRRKRTWWRFKSTVEMLRKRLILRTVFLKSRFQLMLFSRKMRWSTLLG